MKNTYAISTLIKDSNGNIVEDQTDFSFSYSIEDSKIASFEDEENFCTQGIKYPCPNYRLYIYAWEKGHTKINVKVTQKSSGKIIGEIAYELEVK